MPSTETDPAHDAIGAHGTVTRTHARTDNAAVWEHFCFQPLWEDEMFARQA